MADNLTPFAHSLTAVVAQRVSNSFAPHSYPDDYAYSYITRYSYALPMEQRLFLPDDYDDAHGYSDKVLASVVETWAARTENTEQDVVCDLADAYCVLNNITLPDDRRETRAVGQW
jgi:hypothetical protein